MTDIEFYVLHIHDVAMSSLMKGLTNRQSFSYKSQHDSSIFLANSKKNFVKIMIRKIMIPQLFYNTRLVSSRLDEIDMIQNVLNATRCRIRFSRTRGKTIREIRGGCFITVRTKVKRSICCQRKTF